jgi:hypothetical protein
MPAAAWLPFNRRKQDGGGSKPCLVFILERKGLVCVEVVAPAVRSDGGFHRERSGSVSSAVTITSMKRRAVVIACSACSTETSEPGPVR